MALALPNSVFFHIPRTGGTWVRHAIKNAEIKSYEVNCFFCKKSSEYNNTSYFHNNFDTVNTSVLEGKFRFAFVRHPLRFYQSIWKYKMVCGWDKDNDFDMACASDSFEEYVDNCFKFSERGMVTSIYQWYLGEDLSYVDFVGKQEYLYLDLVTALTLAGENFDEEKLFSTSLKNNFSGNIDLPEQCEYSPALKQRVLDREEWVLKIFNYEDEPVDFIPNVNISNTNSSSNNHYYQPPLTLPLPLRGERRKGKDPEY
ncbi:sulfotransferase family protein [Patescibacteria group bacterium]|nr:sulfotransferase family protein [Patescibacteria group bacterium]MBU1123409.1 sulfotransferase family protein [Patescibacteria group bacterium]MBU1911058.1 sulfotransferase family protein [Patescibacteria group bacterium]